MNVIISKQLKAKRNQQNSGRTIAKKLSSLNACRQKDPRSFYFRGHFDLAIP